jgi:hypothetical protein
MMRNPITVVIDSKYDHRILMEKGTEKSFVHKTRINIGH